MTDEYLARARRHAADRDEQLRRSRILSRWRLAAFLPALALLIWASTREASPAAFGASFALFLVFGFLVVRHARVEERAAWHDALHTAALRSIARIERRWDGLPPGDVPDGIDVVHHPYALDLDLFGRASLFQWLGPAATAQGESRLASWLLTPATTGEIGARQQAVTELAAQADWRESLAAHGVLAERARAVHIESFLRWAEGPPAFGRHAGVLHAVVLALVASIWILLALDLGGVVGDPYWLAPLIVGVVLSFAMAKAIHESLERAGAGQHALNRYAAILEHAAAPAFESPWLRAVHARLTAEGSPAPACMRRLNRILGFAEFRTSAALLHFPVQALTLWDFHVLFALNRWQRGPGARVRAWFDALADLDALAALAGVRHDNPAWCLPVVGERSSYRAESLGHPLLPAERRVDNDIEVGPAGTLLLVTGSNMSGKSTMLRAVGLSTVLAQAGGPVCARALEMPAVDLQTSIRVTDSLELGLSYFMAALARLKGVVDAAEDPRPGRVLLYLLDEILQGTNSAERGIAVQGVARHLLAARAIGIMTTHDLNLAGEEPLKSAAKLVHFTEIVDAGGEMRFDYRLRSGLATSRNALRLMQLIGIDVSR